MDNKTPGFPGAGGDSNNNDAATDLTPPSQIPKYPILTTRPPTVIRHPGGYFITSFDRRSFIDASSSSSSSVVGGGVESAGSARSTFKRGTCQPAAAASEAFPAASEAFPAGLMMPSVPKVSRVRPDSYPRLSSDI